MAIPKTSAKLMYHAYKYIFPYVRKELSYWKKRAEKIPNDELRKQALASIEHKTFHCEGGSIMAMLAEKSYKEVIPFIVAYQTISDYLDNLCDRSTSQDPQDFSALHESMSDALTISQTAAGKSYYRFREDYDDGGYLNELVEVCQSFLKNNKNYSLIKEQLIELCGYYCDLQIHKHVKKEERVSRLKNWFDQHRTRLPEMEWYEFSASAGSTLGIFCLVSYSVRDDFTSSHVENIRNGYFPYIQGLHILLDYFIDQDEDRIGGDLNFCFYYDNQEHLFNRLRHFVIEADRHTSLLPHQNFHKLINRGLLGLYLSDNKTNQQTDVQKTKKRLIRLGGMTSLFFYVNAKGYRKWRSAYKNFGR